MCLEQLQHLYDVDLASVHLLLDCGGVGVGGVRILNNTLGCYGDSRSNTKLCCKEQNLLLGGDRSLSPLLRVNLMSQGRNLTRGPALGRLVHLR